jgi:hypothetical protein
MRPVLGTAITAATVLALVIEFLRHQRFPMPARGWIGVTLLVTAEALMFGQVWPVNVYFTPIAWTAYLLIADAMVQAITGMSRMHNLPRDFLLCAALSIPLWTIFELYNLRLANWTYVGVPVSWAGALLGYGWSFATITPGILETADLIEAFDWFRPRMANTNPRVARPSPGLARVGNPAVQFSPRGQRAMVFLGAACLIVPLVIKQHIAAYLFALVWVGFFFLLDPLNYWRGLPSLLGDLAAGRRGRFYSLLLSGWVCGWLWEFWNNWAAAQWHYIFPMFQKWKIFEMPAPGFLGFLPFALECFVMYVSASAALGARAKSVSQSGELTRG